MVVCFVAEQARRGSKEADGEYGRDQEEAGCQGS